MKVLAEHRVYLLRKEQKTVTIFLQAHQIHPRFASDRGYQPHLCPQRSEKRAHGAQTKRQALKFMNYETH